MSDLTYLSPYDIMRGVATSVWLTLQKLIHQPDIQRMLHDSTPDCAFTLRAVKATSPCAFC